VMAEPTSEFCSLPRLDSNGDKSPFEELPLNTKSYCIDSQQITSLEATPKFVEGSITEEVIKINKMTDIRFIYTPLNGY